MVTVKNAIVSVSDKSQLSKLVNYFQNYKVNVYATGGTYSRLRDYKNKINLINLSDYTNFPEIMDGRIKTLHPSIFAGLLAMKNNKVHTQQLEKYNFKFFDLVVVNLYPFENSIKKNHFKESIENIDVGGPAMIRSAAKNFESVIVLTNPNQYKDFIKKGINFNNNFDFEYRRNLAAEAFKLTTYYDAIIANWLQAKLDIKSLTSLPLKKIKDLRYGENPHQKAALYTQGKNPYRHLSGKELSYNNILDLDIAFNLVCEFKETACAIIKHGNPCGVSLKKLQVDAFKFAFNSDKISSFGGIVAFNKKLEKKTAQELSKFFIEAVIAPDFDNEALKFLKDAKKNLIIIKLKPKKSMLKFNIRSTKNFFLIQEFDKKITNKEISNCVTKKKPSAKNIKDLVFALTISKYVNSNAIVIVNNYTTLGIGVGETSRIESAKQAINKIASPVNAVLASDGFFPFPDIISLCKHNKIVSIIQPGGSINDRSVISKANELNISMIFTGKRHFKH